jgi:signal transduction histidine kinase
MKEMTWDTLRLRFPEELEHAFREDHFVKSLDQLRFGIALATLLYALFGILDALIFPQTKAQTWFVRYVVVCPACTLTFLFTYSRHFEKYMQVSVFIAVLVGGVGIIAMMAIVRSPINYFHYAGLLLVIMYTYTFSKLRFLYTALASWMLVGLYEIAAIWILPAPRAVFMNDNFFFIAANLIGMFSCYHRELYARKDFLKSMMIRDLEEEKHSKEKEKIFRDLHDGIGNITTSISLLSEVAQKETSVAEIKKSLATISDLSQEGMVEIRNIMHSFDATQKTWETMAAELRRQGRTMIEPHGILFDIKTSLDADHHEPDSFLWLNLFRIYKEALTNVMKHSKAKTVHVDLTVTREGLLLSICDDGIGIRTEKNLGRGIANMKTRAREIGGNVAITSGKGTMVSLELPLSLQFSAS